MDRKPCEIRAKGDRRGNSNYLGEKKKTEIRKGEGGCSCRWPAGVTTPRAGRGRDTMKGSPRRVASWRKSAVGGIEKDGGKAFIKPPEKNKPD